MSDPTHTIPGQSLLERLFARGAVRPAVGVSASFFERFGLTDPWLDSAQLKFLEEDVDGIYSFLSAAPYYARLRAERQRGYRSRRRLLERLSLSSPLVGRSFERLSQMGPSTGAWLKPSFMANSTSSISDESSFSATARSRGATAMVTGSNSAIAFATAAHSSRAPLSWWLYQFWAGRNCMRVRS